MLIATFQVDHGAIGLAETFREEPELVVEAERIAAHSTEWTMPCLWVAADDFEAVDEALAADPSIDEIIETNEFDGEKYYHLDWADEVDERITGYVDENGSILIAKATDQGWQIQFRFTSRGQFDAFREQMVERGYSFDLLELFEPEAPRQMMGEVTPSQRAALVAATEQGYYKVPREVTAEEVADDLGMTQQSVSELLRRGTDNLVRSTLVTNRRGIDE